MPEFVFKDIFTETVVLLSIAAIIGALALRLRQPLIVAFIAVGILAGPSGLGLVRSGEEIELLAGLGLTLLLFVVGLKLDINMIRSLGLIALAAGFGQIIITAAVAFPIALAVGLSGVSALYVAIAIAFSSTIIIVKLLSDKHEADSLHGRMAVGILIVQDIVVVLVMLGLSGFVGNAHYGVVWEILLFIIKGTGLLAGLALAIYLLLPWLLSQLARSAELLVLFAIAWAVGLAALSQGLGFSKEVGAFLAGVSLASTAYREIIGARLVSLRDFLLLFFFIDLGRRLDLGLLGGQVWAAIPLSIFVLAIKPLIVVGLMVAFGYRIRTSSLTGISLGQISEFSLIFIGLGLSLGHISQNDAGLVTLVGLITIGISTYGILHSHSVYERVRPLLRSFEKRAAIREDVANAEQRLAYRAEVVLFGLGRYGSSLARQLIEQGRTILGVDFDPQAVRHWNESGRTAVFGDAEDPEFPAALPLSKARWVISSLRDLDINKALIYGLANHGYGGSVAVTANSYEEASILRSIGADVVFMPFADAAAEAADMLTAADEQERRRKMDKLIAGLNDHYIVCGYGRMGQQIVKDFRRYRVPHVVVERNPIQIPRLIEDGVPFVEGKASEDKVLSAAGIERAKGLVAVAATDEENVFIVLTSRGLNPKLYIVARSILQENEDKLRRAGADKVMSPYILGGHRMATAVLKPRVMDFLDVVIHEPAPDLEVEVVTVAASASFVGKAIKDSGIRQQTGVLILAVRRPGGEILSNPPPEFLLQAEDEVFVLGTPYQVEAAERLFES